MFVFDGLAVRTRITLVLDDIQVRYVNDIVILSFGNSSSLIFSKPSVTVASSFHFRIMSAFFGGQCVMRLKSLITGVDDGLMKHGTSMALPISFLPWFSLTISCCCLSVSFQDHVCLLCWPMCHATREFDEEVDDDGEHTLSCFIAILQQFTVDTFQ